MYNRKSKTSAIITIISAILIFGLMILLPFVLNNTELEGVEAFAAILVSIIFSILPLYLSAIPYFIVGLVFGIRMLKQQSRKKLISFNVSALIATCVLLPFLAWGVFASSELIFNSSLSFFPIVYTVATAVAYVGSLIAQIVTIALLKKSPEENVEPITE